MGTGAGHRGYCLVCDHAGAVFLNRRLEESEEDARGRKVFNAARAQEFALELGLTFSRETWYNHVKHITHPLITLAKAAQASPVIQPKSNQGVLEMIRDIGMKRAMENPEEVTVDHAIKAASALESRKLGSDNVIVMLAKFMAVAKPEELTGGEIIVGQWRELPAEVEEGIA